MRLAIRNIAQSHLSKPSGESSKIVPTLMENCFLQSRHFHIRRVLRNDVRLDLATRANRLSVVPSQGREELNAGKGIGEEFDGFHQGSGDFNIIAG